MPTNETDHIAELVKAIDAAIAGAREDLGKLEAARKALAGETAGNDHAPRSSRSRSRTTAGGPRTARADRTPSAIASKRRQRRPQRNVSALIDGALTKQPQTAPQLATAAGLENGTSVYRVLKSGVTTGKITQSELDGKRAYALAAK